MEKTEAVLVTSVSRAGAWRELSEGDYKADLEVDGQRATDALLTLAAKSGDSVAFDELARRHSTRIKRHVYRIVRNWEDAEDVLQDSLLKAFRNIEQFRSDCTFSTWLTRIAINSALMVLRRRRRRAQISDIVNATTLADSLILQELPDLSPNPEFLYAERQVQESLRGAILHLPWCFRS